MITKDTPYEVKKVSFPHSDKYFYVLFYKGEMLPNQTTITLEEGGNNGITTVTVTFELLDDPSSTTN